MYRSSQGERPDKKATVTQRKVSRKATQYLQQTKAYVELQGQKATSDSSLQEGYGNSNQKDSKSLSFLFWKLHHFVYHPNLVNFSPAMQHLPIGGGQK